MLISILTATYNSETTLQSAIDSYVAQNYTSKELVMIDGKSSDSTLSIISAYLHAIDRYVSEKDSGIYDALNKGIDLAKGEIIGILHSDDLLASADVLRKVAEEFERDEQLMAVYGDLQYVDKSNTERVIRHWHSGNFMPKDFEKGWMPPHPTLFIKKSCFHQFGDYDLAYHSAADYELILRMLYRNQIKTAYIPEVLVKMRVGGLSNASLKNRWKANLEDRRAMKQNGIPHPWLTACFKPLRKLPQYWNKNL